MKKAMIRLAVFGLLIGVAWGAGEINNLMTFKVEKGYLSYQRSLNVLLNITAANPNMAGGTVLVSSNWTQIATGDVVTNGWAFFRNLNTNGVYCQLSVTNDGTAIWARIGLSEFAFLPLDPTTCLYARANATSAVSVAIERVVIDR